MRGPNRKIYRFLYKIPHFYPLWGDYWYKSLCMCLCICTVQMVWTALSRYRSTHQTFSQKCEHQGIADKNLNVAGLSQQFCFFCDFYWKSPIFNKICINIAIFRYILVRIGSGIVGNVFTTFVLLWNRPAGFLSTKKRIFPKFWTWPFF